MLKGQIYITNDKNVVLNMINNFTIVIIGERDEQLVSQAGANMASILAPDYRSLALELDGNIDAFIVSYTSHLAEPECVSYISNMIEHLYRGGNILLYLNKDESEMMYSKIFIQYMRDVYGIYIGMSDTEPFFYDINYNVAICNLLYLHENITVEEFFINYPPSIEIHDSVIMKLAYEINPYIDDPNLENYKRYFYNYKESIKKNNNIFLQNPISKKR